MKTPDNHLLIIFGASGDLTYRKLVPAVFDLYNQKLLPEGFGILGLGRTELSNDNFREKMALGIKEFALNTPKDDNELNAFLNMLYYYALDTKSPDSYKGLKTHIDVLNQKLNTSENYIYYLATPPELYSLIPGYLAAQGLNDQSKGFKRLIVEKPFGYDLKSAKELNQYLQQQFEEEQIYRIDHYLGKETVQNLLVTRFSNGIFEPLWNRNYIDHIEITSSEKIGVGDRGGYYDNSGALRDMVQNHLTLLAGLIAMEPPIIVDSRNIRDEIVKVFHSFRPIKEEDVPKQVIRGQYLPSNIRGEAFKGYRDEKGVAPNARTETFVAMKVLIDNWRWAGVPFYIRTGKMLPTRVTEIVIYFKSTPHHLFVQHSQLGSQMNQLVIRIQPDEGLLLKIGMKVPGGGFRVQTVNMDFHYKDLSDAYLPSAYERLLLDCMLGDSTLYHRGDAVEAAWKFVDPILKAWNNNPCIKVYGYPAGSWGPDVSDDLIEGDNTTWRYPCKNLSNDDTYCEL